jgi:hypothetical protein
MDKIAPQLINYFVVQTGKESACGDDGSSWLKVFKNSSSLMNLKLGKAKLQ